MVSYRFSPVGSIDLFVMSLRWSYKSVACIIPYTHPAPIGAIKDSEIIDEEDVVQIHHSLRQCSFAIFSPVGTQCV